MNLHLSLIHLLLKLFPPKSLSKSSQSLVLSFYTQSSDTAENWKLDNIQSFEQVSKSENSFQVQNFHKASHVIKSQASYMNINLWANTTLFHNGNKVNLGFIQCQCY